MLTDWSKRCIVAILSLAVSVAAFGSALAQAGHVSVFADPAASSCILFDSTPAQFNVYVIHTNISHPHGIISSQFRIEPGSGFSATYLGEAIPMSRYVGSVMTGILIAYDNCSIGTLLVATVTFEGHGTSATCSYLDIGPDPRIGATKPVAQTCFFDLIEVTSVGRLYVNPTAGQCEPYCAVTTRATTWGSVKALYRT